MDEVVVCDEHRLALLPALKSYRRTGCFPEAHEVPDRIVDFVRRAAEPGAGGVADLPGGRGPACGERTRPWDTTMVPNHPHA
ncbi:hypothetical protein, partial [Streptomyces wuyuanensis]|uniref:hypothetical protein n=1 Tax=Streptomyces wuyuanensis TaxID=1196353 RepID=UPI003D71E7F0